MTDAADPYCRPFTQSEASAYCPCHVCAGARKLRRHPTLWSAAAWFAKTLCCCNGRTTAGCVLGDIPSPWGLEEARAARDARQSERD